MSLGGIYEQMFESDKVRNGVFFHFILEGLRGKAPLLNGEWTLAGLGNYVRRRVSRQTPGLVGGGAKQKPNLKADLSGESLVLVRLTDDKKPDLGRAEVKLPRSISNSIGMKLVLVPAGTFTMGSPKSQEKRDDGERQHAVEISRPFYLGVFEVTQKQFREVMGYNPSCFSPSAKGKQGATYVYKPGRGAKRVKGDTSTFPVENLSWEEADEFCKKLSQRKEEKAAGRVYRLPREAEWEYSCRERGIRQTRFTSAANSPENGEL